MARLGQLSSINGTSGRGLAFLGMILQHSAYARALDQYSAWEEEGTEFQFYPVPDSTLAIQKRSEGGSYTSTNLKPDNPIGGSLYFMGGSVTIDITRKADAKRGLRNTQKWLDKELRTRGRKFANDFEVLQFKGSGSGTPAEFKGLSTILSGANLPGFNESRVASAADYAADASAVSFDISDAASGDLFLEMLTYELTTVDDPQTISMSALLFGRIQTIAHKHRRITADVDSFGKQILRYDGIPFVKVRDTAITQDEPNKDSSENNCTSVYIEGFAEQENSLVTNSGLYYMEWDHTDNEEKGKEVYEVRAARKIENPKRIKRIRHIQLKPTPEAP